MFRNVKIHKKKLLLFWQFVAKKGKKFSTQINDDVITLLLTSANYIYFCWQELKLKGSKWCGTSEYTDSIFYDVIFCFFTNFIFVVVANICMKLNGTDKDDVIIFAYVSKIYIFLLTCATIKRLKIIWNVKIHNICFADVSIFFNDVIVFLCSICIRKSNQPLRNYKYLQINSKCCLYQTFTALESEQNPGS